MMKRLPEFHSVRTIAFTPRDLDLPEKHRRSVMPPRYLHIATVRTQRKTKWTDEKLETLIFSDNDYEVNPRAVVSKWRLQHTKLFEPVLEVEQRELPLAS